MQSQEASNLFTIPIELRLHIYALVARNTVKDILTRQHDRKAGLVQEQHHTLSFLRTCKRLYDEARDVAHREFFACIEIPSEPYNSSGPHDRNMDSTQKFLRYLQQSLIFPSPTSSALHTCSTSIRNVTFMVHSHQSIGTPRPNFKSIVLKNASLFSTLKLTHITIVFLLENSDLDAQDDKMALTRTILTLISLISTLERLDICTELRSSVRRMSPHRRYYPFGFQILYHVMGRHQDSHFDMEDMTRTMRVLEEKWHDVGLVIGVKGSWMRDALSRIGVLVPTANADSDLSGDVLGEQVERRVVVHFMNAKERERFLS